MSICERVGRGGVSGTRSGALLETRDARVPPRHHRHLHRLHHRHVDIQYIREQQRGCMCVLRTMIRIPRSTYTVTWHPCPPVPVDAAAHGCRQGAASPWLNQVHSK